MGLLTGADSDVAQAMARALAADGMSLMLIARPGTHVRELAETLEREHGVRCFPAAADVEDPEAVDRLIMHAEQHLGAIDVLISTVPGCVAAALRPTMEQRGRGNIIDLTDGEETTAAEILALLTGR
ncbi:MAG TPA: SDR family NAD(P)-dependent oxidoreductase [Aeromicrobium sp.]|nr:SDR family NAD(P)-dependent oxidoreductase [Aeromicrobium sp.]